MRLQARNKETMYYAEQAPKTTIFKRDTDGNIMYYFDNGIQKPYIQEVVREAYINPKEFKASFSMSGLGESQEVDYGIDKSNYSAIIICEKNSVPLTEKSLIWKETIPISDANGIIDKKTADYKVVAVRPSLNYDRYLVDKVVK